MSRNRFVRTMGLVVLAVFSLSMGANQAGAQQAAAGRDPNAVKARQKQRVTMEQRLAAAANAAKGKKKGGPQPAGAAQPRAAGAAPRAVGAAPMPLAGTAPDYFGTPNWANTPSVRKFVDKLPQLGPTGANGLVTLGGDPAGQYLAIANPDKLTYPGSDYYELELRQYSEQMHSDLPPTKLQGYVQVNNGTDPAYVGTDPAAGNTVAPAPIHYLGPSIVATKDRPVRIKFTNKLPTGMPGDLFIPVDLSSMGAGMGPYRAMPMMADRVGGAGATVEITTMDPHKLQVGERIMLMDFAPAAYNGMFSVVAVPSPTTFQVTLAADPGGPATLTAKSMVMENFTQNRATLHLHGGLTPWISDGTAHQWTTPAGEITQYPKGVSVQNVPDMPDPGDGSITFFYTNQQSARLMFYHDHAWGITRLNVYTGEAAGYLLTDQTEQDLITAGLLPDIGLPLVIQDKTFVDAATLPSTDPTWNSGTQPGSANTGDLWYPHVYMPNQNPSDLSGANAFGRWDYGPFFWPPWPTANPPIQVADGTLGFGLDGQPDLIPNLPNVSMTMEAFHDTPLVNGTLYPYMDVLPKTYRFRVLNAANDRMWNLQLYQATNIVGGITIGNPGSGYTTVPQVTITPDASAGDTTGHGATALATVDLTDPASATYGQVVAIDLVSVGSGYTAPPIVTIAAATGASPVTATATATLYNAAPTEVGMVPAVPGAANFPVAWTAQTVGQPGDILDGRAGGVPDPALIGPSIVQIGTEGGFLPAPVVWPNIPVGFTRNPKDIVVGSVQEHNLFLGPAERADILIDFSQFAGKTILLYNDAPAAVPAADSRLDYYTCNFDMTAVGGHAPTQPGLGPNTRTIMQFRVAAGSPPAGAYVLDAAKFQALQAAFATDPATGTPGVFAKSQEPILVPQAAYNSAYNAAFPGAGEQFSKIQSTSLGFFPLAINTPAPVGDQVLTKVTMPLGAKAIHELFENEYGRMNALLGIEMKFTNGLNQTTIPYPFINPPTEFVDNTPEILTTPIGTAGDGTQIWKITHNGVDTHPVHFHLFNVQLINRVGWDGAIRGPEGNELGWKETVRMNPLEDCIVALRASAPKQPFGLPDNIRPLNPMRPLNDPCDFFNVDTNGNPITPPLTNVMYNFGWEYTWHCHILSHEEMDMMRPMVFHVGSSLPLISNLAVSAGTTASLMWTDGTPASDPATVGNPANEIGFRIERAVNGGAFAVLGTALANATSFTDNTILPASWYSYRVIAFNAAGDSMSNVATIAMAPGASLNITAVAGNAQATVSFSPPASNGGSAITLYTVTSSPDASHPSGVTATGSASPITVPGLTIGTSYTFTVTATNAVGTGPASSPSNAVTPFGPPGAPLAVSAVAGPAQATVSFSPPASNGGSAITLYTVTSSPDASHPSGVTATGSASPITVPGLTIGTSYTFTVTATNAAGTGPASSPSNAVTPTGVNLALGRPAVASTTYPGFPASNTTDGNLTTRWSSNFSNNQWIYVDLGAVATIQRVVLRWEAAYGQSYRIQVSNNAVTWTDVYSTTTGNGAIDDIPLATPAIGRYVRMLGIQRATVYGYSLFEFEVYGVFGAPVNLALGRPAVASTTYPGFPAANTTDGNLATRWSSAFSNNQWMYVDLGSVLTIQRVVLNWEAAYAQSFRIEVSNDAVTWTSVYSTTTGTGGINNIMLATPATGRYVRMLGIQRATAFGYSLFEFEVY